MKNVNIVMYKKILVGVITAGIISVGGLKFASSAKSVEASTPCVVTIFGQQYDISPLGATHSGPRGTTLINVGGSTFFQCGADMTSVYQGMHGTDVSRLIPYIYVVPTAIPTTLPTEIPTPIVSPTITSSPLPSVSPVPSISPSPKHEDNDDVNELNEINEDKNKTNNVRGHKENHGQVVREVARKNTNSSNHESDRDND
ncbi:MAG: hypothetical protein NTU76_01215 [Candidatus Taylorbacteria bacterium]|nr:hypothetical protein [Candidatus Taylorbacteria bacterium]